MSLYDGPRYGGGHDHDNPGELTVGCSACVARVAHDQEQAALVEAPVRRVTWHCSYLYGLGSKSGRLTFTREVKVPIGWIGSDVDEHYAEMTGGAFLSALPSTVPMAETDEACGSMEVERVVIGDIVSEPAPVTEPSLFEVAS